MKKTAIFAFMVCVAQILIPAGPGPVQRSLFLYGLQRNDILSHGSLIVLPKYDNRGCIIGYKTLQWNQNLGQYVAVLETTCQPKVVRK